MSFFDGIKEVAAAVGKGITTAGTASWRFGSGRYHDAKYLLRGELNYDIVRDGKLILSPADFRPGDVMVKQTAYREGADIASYAISGAQATFNGHRHRYVCAYLLGHAALYVGERTIDGVTGNMCESVDGGTRLSGLSDHHNRHYAWYVIRPRDGALAEAAVRHAVAAVGKADYALAGALYGGLIGGGGINRVINESLRNDSTRHDAAIIDAAARGTKGASMFCSEFVTYCLNRAADDLGRDRIFDAEQNTITPEDLYATLRDRQDWDYIGELKRQ